MTAPPERAGFRQTIRRWNELAATPAHGRRVLVAASFTAQPLEAPLGVAMFDHDSQVPAISFAPHNQVFQVCLSPDEFGVQEGSEVVILWRIEDLFERDFHAFCDGDVNAAAAIADSAAAFAGAVGALAQRPGVHVTLGDCTTPIGFGLDHLDGELLARLRDLEHAVNSVVDNHLTDTPLERVRMSSLQAAHGTLASFDRRTWLMYRQPFTDWFSMHLGVEIADVIHRRTAAFPKVLVLDCDNTLWGGVSGEEGIAALQCSDAFPGSAYRAFQQAVQRLRRQGVLVALVSKNDELTVRDVFQSLDGMVLTDDDIVARRVNWDPKPANIAEIAAELNLGLDSFVFVDDSAHELGAVNAELPLIRTLLVPDDLEELPDLLATSGWFRGLRVSVDDERRTSRVRTETERVHAAAGMTHDEFLASLGLVVRVRQVDDGSVGRVVQLINKTNQFNVTTIRRSEAEVRHLLLQPTATVRVIEVEDRFGDYGLVGVAIVDLTETDRPVFDTFLMSCRVLGRGVETAFLSAIVGELRERTAGPIVGRYEPTAKNGLVADLFERHGFVPTAEGRRFELPAEAIVDRPSHVTVVAG